MNQFLLRAKMISMPSRAEFIRFFYSSFMAFLLICSQNSAADPVHNGSHDFDLQIGTWKVHVSRLLHPLTGSKDWVQYDGKTVVRPVWGGRANLAELEVNGQAGHMELLSLRLYNPKSGKWNIYVANSNNGTLGVPAVGSFKNGRGEFFDRESWNGHPIVVRFIITPKSHNKLHFEQAFSPDGGKTWELNWVADATRMR